jgi:hypothetical protein
LKHGSEFLMQGFHQRLQEEMRPALGPLHLLLLAEALADHLIDRRFDKADADALPHGRTTVQVVVGGLELLNADGSDGTLIANAIITVSVDDGT